MVAITVEDEALRDEVTPIGIEGLDSVTSVTLVAQTEAFGGTESRATFEVSDGVVSTAEHAPVSGTYEGVQPMGWLWSMEPTEGSASGAQDFVTIELEARVDGKTRARATTIRRPGVPDIETRPVDAEDVAGELFVPPGDGPHPAVMALHGSGGHSMEDLGRLLASHGYSALDLSWFGDDPATPTEEMVDVPLEYFDRAAEWMGSQDEVANAPIGLWGGSVGGEAALLLGARFDWVGCVVAVAPSPVLFESPKPDASKWSWRGEPLPHLSFPPEGEQGEDRNWPFPWEAALDASDGASIDAATIAVEEIDAPVLLVSGRDDTLWPATRLTNRALDRLESSDVPFEYEHLAYEDAGHKIFPPYYPTAVGTVGGTPLGNAHAAADHWPRALRYLERGLGST